MIRPVKNLRVNKTEMIGTFEQVSLIEPGGDDILTSLTAVAVLGYCRRSKGVHRRRHNSLGLQSSAVGDYVSMLV